MDFLQQGLAWLEAQRQRFLTQMVTYRRGEQHITIAATLGQSTHRSVDAEGLEIRTQSVDFLVAASELQIDGVKLMPQAGDRITLVCENQTQLYEVMAPAGEGVFRECEPYGQTLRIHTKRIN